MQRFLIVNADDFGASRGVNRGIVDCHLRGIVTSTSLMTSGRAVHEAVAMARDVPALSIGLHWDVCGEDERDFNLQDVPAVRREFAGQLARFRELMGRDPTHIDSHRHLHRERGLLPVFQELVQPLGIPLRHTGEVRFEGGFYAQWEWKVTDLHHVSIEFLQELLRLKVRSGWTEFSCHPGYRSADYDAVYLAEREVEIQTLTDPRIRETIAEEHIELASYHDYLEWKRSAGEPASSSSRCPPAVG